MCTLIHITPNKIYNISATPESTLLPLSHLPTPLHDRGNCCNDLGFLGLALCFRALYKWTCTKWALMCLASLMSMRFIPAVTCIDSWFFSFP